MSTSGRNSASSADKAEGTNRSTKEKLRSACDNCAGSKVRCTKEQPICQRCHRLGLECIYGPSQRRGKPPMNRRGSHASVSGPITSDPESSVAMSDRLAVPEAAWASNRVDAENAYFPGNLGLASSSSWDGYPTLSAAELVSSYVPIAMPPPSMPYEMSSDSQIHSLSGSPYASYSSLQSNAFPSMATIHGPSVSANACFNEASAALNALYCLDQLAHVPITLNVPMTAGGMGSPNLNISSPSLETVRSAITTINRLSVCDCSNCISDRTLPFLLIAIVSKILDRLRSIYIFEFRSSRTSTQFQSPPGSIPASQWPGAAADNLSSTYPMIDAASAPSTMRNNRTAIASGLLLLLQTLEVTNEQQLRPRLSRVDDAMSTPIQHAVADMLRQNMTNLRIALEAMRN